MSGPDPVVALTRRRLPMGGTLLVTLASSTALGSVGLWRVILQLLHTVSSLFPFLVRTAGQFEPEPLVPRRNSNGSSAAV